MKNKISLHKIINYITLTIIKSRFVLMMITTMFVFLVAGSNEKAYAFSMNTSPAYAYDNYNVTMSFKNEGVITGEGKISFKADLTGMKTVTISSLVRADVCQICGGSHFEYGTLMRFDINGRSLYYSNYCETKDPSNKSNWSTVTSNLYESDGKDSLIEVYYRAVPIICWGCNSYVNPSIYFDGITFKGERAHASFSSTSIETLPGGQITVSPNYDANTHHVQWGIRYPGESGFTPLTEGQNPGGITVTGATNKAITVSNIPYTSGGFDLGVFTYTQSGDLPGGTEFPNTPFYTHVTCKDVVPPTVKVTKTVNPNGGPVTISISAGDDGGLSDTPYSFDGGKTYGAENIKVFDKVGTYQIVVRDKAGNTTRESFYIDSLDLKNGGTPSAGSGAENTPGEKAPESGKGEGGSGGTSPGGGGLPGSGGKNDANGPGAGTGSLDSAKNDGKDHVTGGNTSNTDKDVKDIAAGTKSSKGTKDGKGNKGGNLSASNINDEDSEDTFERIKENSEEYIISMQENNAEGDKTSAKEGSVSMDMSDDGSDYSYGEEYADSGNVNTDGYVPNVHGQSTISIVLIVILVIMFLVILAFILFFGVIIFAEKETELSKINGTEGVKVPIAISIITYSRKNKKFSICFRELLDKHDVLYARAGVLFTYMYEGEKIGIQTKFKGDKKREIATEKVRKEIKVGNRKNGR